MKKEDLLKFAQDDKYISGIYNYCDQWCERCPFTAECMSFAMSKQQSSDQEDLDVQNEAFWQRLSESFRTTLELVREMAEQEGIDLDALDADEEQEQRRLDDEVTTSHKCCRMAQAYTDKVDDWFESARGIVEQEENGTAREMHVEIETADLLETGATCEDAMEVVDWYQHQIYAKLMRAVGGSLREQREPLDEFAKDSDGSAKVALIGMDRSMGAWGKLRTCFIQLEDKVTDILMHLEGLRRCVEEAFPAAREFVRPGFDRVSLNS